MKRQLTNHVRVMRLRGFTVVECLIVLAISAMLLTAIAVAFNASLHNYEENEEMFRAVNSARQALARMTSEIRTAGYYDSGLDAWLGVMQASPSNQCEFWTWESDGAHHIIYEYRDATDANDPNTLMLIRDDAVYTLCDNVTAASFTKAPADADPSDAKSVVISLSVKAGDSERTLSAAAVIRRNLTY